MDIPYLHEVLEVYLVSCVHHPAGSFEDVPLLVEISMPLVASKMEDLQASTLLHVLDVVFHIVPDATTPPSPSTNAQRWCLARP